jgi:hypothetical protein
VAKEHRHNQDKPAKKPSKNTFDAVNVDPFAGVDFPPKIFDGVFGEEGVLKAKHLHVESLRKNNKGEGEAATLSEKELKRRQLELEAEEHYNQAQARKRRLALEYGQEAEVVVSKWQDTLPTKDINEKLKGLREKFEPAHGNGHKKNPTPRSAKANSASGFER